MASINRIIATFMAFANLLLGSLGLAGKPDSGREEKFRVTSYVVAQQVQDEKNVHSEDFDIITDVILFGCVTFNADGSLNIEEETMDTALKNLRAAIGDRNVKIHLNVLGPGPETEHADWNDSMLDQGRQHTNAFKSGVLEENLVSFVTDNGFDGLFFDYEYPLNYTNWTPFNQFLVRIDSLLGDKILGLAVTEWDTKLSLGSYLAVDRFEVMLYDVYDEDGKHSTVQKSEDLMRIFYKFLIPREKIDFGLPSYARPSDRDAYWYAYREYFDKLDENGWFYDENIDKKFWFNRPEDIAEKTQFALDEGLGGVMFWSYACDLPSSLPDSLLGAAGNAIDNYVPADKGVGC